MLAVFAVLLRLGLGVGHALAVSGLPADSRGPAFAFAASICTAGGGVARTTDGSGDPAPRTTVCPVCLAAGGLVAALPSADPAVTPVGYTATVYAPGPRRPSDGSPAGACFRSRAPPASA